MPFQTRENNKKNHPTGDMPQPPHAGPRWGDPGVSERLIVQDTSIIPQPTAQQLILADAGILATLAHRISGTATITHGTGTNAKDPFGPYNVLQTYQLVAGAATPLVNISGTSLGILQVVEWPGRSWEANATPAGVQNPLTNPSDYFNHPAATGVFNFWARIPVALPWAGMPGGAVGYLILQNKRIANVIKAAFNLSGNASPYNLYSAVGAVAGAGAYQVTGNDTVTAALIMENWKELYTVPDSPAKMPRFGFTRYLQEVALPYAGSSFTYNLEPGGVLLRAILRFFDAGAGTAGTGAGVATANVQSLTYQYGTNKQVDVFTPQRNILEQLDLYGRTLPQGTYVFDYYTRKRNLTDAKSTENIANIQLVANFASGYAVPANSMAFILLDKVFVVQQRLAR